MFPCPGQKRFVLTSADYTSRLLLKGDAKSQTGHNEDDSGGDDATDEGPAQNEPTDERHTTRTKPMTKKRPDAKPGRRNIIERDLLPKDKLPGFLGLPPFSLTWGQEAKISATLTGYMSTIAAWNRDRSNTKDILAIRNDPTAAFLLVTGWTYMGTEGNKNIARNTRHLRVAAYLASILASVYRAQLLSTGWAYFRQDIHNLLSRYSSNSKTKYFFIDRVAANLTSANKDEYFESNQQANRVFVHQGLLDHNAIRNAFEHFLDLRLIRLDPNDLDSPVNQAVLQTLNHLNQVSPCIQHHTLFLI